MFTANKYIKIDFRNNLNSEKKLKERREIEKNLNRDTSETFDEARRNKSTYVGHEMSDHYRTYDLIISLLD